MVVWEGCYSRLGMRDVCVSEFALGDGGGIVASQLTDLRFEQQLEEAAGKAFLCVLITGHVFVAHVAMTFENVIHGTMPGV